jgi:hypothetical protein
VAHTLIDVMAGLLLGEWLLPPERVAHDQHDLQSSQTREA